MSSYIQNGALVNGMGCYFPGWGVSKRVGVLANGTGCYCTGWGVLIQNAVLVYWMQC